MYSLLSLILLSLNLSLSRSYDAVEVEGEYPEVLPHPNNKQAVGYDKSTNNILIVGGSNHNKQGVTFNIGDLTFDDLGTDYMSAGTAGNDYYTQIGNDLWMINAFGSGFIKINTETRDVNVPTVKFPTIISSRACLASHENYLFVVGGYYHNRIQNIVQIYDINNDKWIMNAPLMQDARSLSGCIVNNNKLYVIGGYQLDTIEYMDVSGNLNNDLTSREWQYVDGHLPTTLRSLSTVNYGNKIIILGGKSDDDDPVYSVNIPVIDTVSNSFSNNEGSLSYPIYYAGSIIVGGRIYVVGGSDTSSSLIDSYQYIDIPDILQAASISNGTIFLIVFAVSIFVYCVGGYIFNGYKSKKWGDVQHNIPQFVFWRHLPLWVYAGCKVSYEFCRKRMNDDEQQQLIETDDVRETDEYL